MELNNDTDRKQNKEIQKKDSSAAGAAKKNSGSASFIKKIKRKPLLAIIPIVILVLIIVLIIILAANCNGSNSTQEETETETTVYEKPRLYDTEKWKSNGQFMTYDDPAYTTETGIDVSEWSKEIDWEKVKASGIDFAICRVGYRGYETGRFAFDPKLSEYLQGAQDAGLKIGAYFVTQAINEEEAEEEALEVIERVKDFNINMPIYIDCEANAGAITRTDDMTKEQHTKNVIAFCKKVEEAGYRGGVYSNETWINAYLNLDELSDFDIWVARYTATPPDDMAFNMWQYASDGAIEGITTDVDLNIRLEKK